MEVSLFARPIQRFRPGEVPICLLSLRGRYRGTSERSCGLCLRRCQCAQEAFMYHHVKKLMYTVNVGEPDPSSIPSFSDEPERIGEEAVVIEQMRISFDEGAQPGFRHVRDEIV